MTRVEQLEGEIARLEAELVTAHSLLRNYGWIPSPSVACPSAADIGRLIEMVTKKYPQLRPLGIDSETYRRHFAAACEYFSFAHVLDKPQSGYSVDFFLDFARREFFLARRGIETRLDPYSFTAPAIACGVPYEKPDVSPVSMNLGLARSFAGSPQARWQQTLKRGVCPEPHEPARPPPRSHPAAMQG